MVEFLPPPFIDGHGNISSGGGGTIFKSTGGRIHGYMKKCLSTHSDVVHLSVVPTLSLF